MPSFNEGTMINRPAAIIWRLLELKALFCTNKEMTMYLHLLVLVNVVEKWQITKNLPDDLFNLQFYRG